MRAVLDTSVLIGTEPPPAGIETAVSVVSIGELHFGLLLTDDPDDFRHVADVVRVARPSEPLTESR